MRCITSGWAEEAEALLMGCSCPLRSESQTLAYLQAQPPLLVNLSEYFIFNFTWFHSKQCPGR